MKKIIGILGIIFIFVLSTFSQNEVNGTVFEMTIDGNPTNNFMVTHNQQYMGGGGTLLILFEDILNTVDFQGNGNISVVGISDFYRYPSRGVGIYMIKIEFLNMVPGTINIVATSSNYNFVDFTEQDTINAYSNGINSVDTDYFFNLGVESVDTQHFFDSGVSSVDTMKYFNMGVASVNTDSIFQSGVNSVKSVDTMIFFNNGVASVNTDSVGVFYDIGFADGMSLASNQTTATTKSVYNFNVDVYPNPVNNGDYVNINCFDYSHVDIYTVTGQTIEKGITDTFISTDRFKNGVYIFNIWNTQNKYKIVKIIVQ